MSAERIRASQTDFVNALKKKKKWLRFSATKLLEKQRVPLLSICRIIDRYLRNTAVSI